MKKLKLVALLAVLALTVATFVTMLVMPASAAAIEDTGSDSTVYSTNSTDCIGHFVNSSGATVGYAKSMAAVHAKLGASGYVKFVLDSDITIPAGKGGNVDPAKYPGRQNWTCTNATANNRVIIDGNGHTITTSVASTHYIGGYVTWQNITITGSASHLLQVIGGDVVLGSGMTVNNTKVGGYPVIINKDQKITVDGATVTGNLNSTDGIIAPWDTGCTIVVKSGTIRNTSAAQDTGPAGLCFRKANTTIEISGGTIEACRPINYPSTDHKTNKLTITGGTLTCNDPDDTTNNSYCITWSSDTANATVNITGGTFNGKGTFLAAGGKNNTLNFGGNAVINTARESRGFIQDGSSTNNTYNITGGTITSVGYGFVNLGTNAKVNITGGTVKAVANNFFHLQANKGQTIKISGNAKIICGESETVHERNFINPTIADCGVKFTIEGGTIYCGDVLETGGNTDIVVDLKGGTIYCENALCSAGATAGGVLNISGGDITCTNGALYVTTGNALLNINDGAKINATSLVRVRYENATTGDTAATGCGRLRMFGGNITTTSDAINLELNTSGDVSYTSDIEIYGGTITAPNNQLIDVNRGGGGRIAIYGGEFKAKGRIAGLQTGPQTSVTLDIYGGTFKSLLNSTDNGLDHTITTGIVFISSSQAEINVYGGRFYILTDLNDITKLADTGAHLVAWAGAIDKMDFYGGEFFGGTHVQQRLMNTSSAVDTSKSTYIAMTTGGYFASPVTRDGASIRVSADSMGIRFQSSISKAVLDRAKTFGTVKYGTIITPLDFGMKLGAALLNSSSNYVKIEATSAGTTTDANGNVTFNAALTNIKEANLGREFVACAYIEITTTSGEVVTIYAVDKAIRSIDQVAKAALADYKTDAEITEGDKTTYKYMTTIYCDKATKEVVYGGTPVYTRFNNAQVAAIAKQMVLG